MVPSREGGVSVCGDVFEHGGSEEHEWRHALPDTRSRSGTHTESEALKEKVGDGEASNGEGVGTLVDGREEGSGVVAAKVEEVAEAEDAGAPEVSGGVLALEAEVLPVLGLPLHELPVREGHLPQVPKTLLVLLLRRIIAVAHLPPETLHLPPQPLLHLRRQLLPEQSRDGRQEGGEGVGEEEEGHPHVLQPVRQGEECVLREVAEIGQLRRLERGARDHSIGRGRGRRGGRRRGGRTGRGWVMVLVAWLIFDGNCPVGLVVGGPSPSDAVFVHVVPSSGRLFSEGNKEEKTRELKKTMREKKGENASATLLGCQKTYY